MFGLVFVTRDFELAETSLVRGRPSGPYGANFLTNATTKNHDGDVLDIVTLLHNFTCCRLAVRPRQSTFYSNLQLLSSLRVLCVPMLSHVNDLSVHCTCTLYK